MDQQHHYKISFDNIARILHVEANDFHLWGMTGYVKYGVTKARCFSIPRMFHMLAFEKGITHVSVLVTLHKESQHLNVLIPVNELYETKQTDTTPANID